MINGVFGGSICMYLEGSFTRELYIIVGCWLSVAGCRLSIIGCLLFPVCIGFNYDLSLFSLLSAHFLISHFLSGHLFR